MTTATTGGGSRLLRVGQAVAERRLDLGLSQRQLALKAGVGLNTAALLERGHTFPRAANARKIENALEWPRGTLAELRRGGSLPGSAPAPHASVNPAGGAQASVIAQGVVGVAATCMRILTERSSDPAAAAALRELDARLLGLETAIAASLPHAESFDETVSALSEVHRLRATIRQAAHAASA